MPSIGIAKVQTREKGMCVCVCVSVYSDLILRKERIIEILSILLAGI